MSDVEFTVLAIGVLAFCAVSPFLVGEIMPRLFPPKKEPPPPAE